MASIVDEIKLPGKNVLTELYQAHRKEFIQWAMNTYQCENDEAKDIYQATIISFYENVVNGKLTVLTSTSKTYLFAIGKNKIREMKRKQGKYSPLDGALDFPEEVEELADPELIQLVTSSLDRLGEPCKSLLQQVYYHRSSMAAIVKSLGYKNEDAAKSQKYKCLVRLRTIFKSLQIKVMGV